MKDYRRIIILRMKNLRYMLMDRDNYPINTRKRDKILIEYKVLESLLLGEEKMGTYRLAHKQPSLKEVPELE